MFQGRIQDFQKGGSRAQSARKIFSHHAHFTYRFRVRELCARIILHKTYNIIIQRDINARDWTDSRTGLARKDTGSKNKNQ